MLTRNVAFLPITSTVIALSLFGCGGGGSDGGSGSKSTNPGSGGGTQITELEFRNAMQANGVGLWLAEVSANEAIDGADYADIGRHYTVNNQFNISTVISIIDNDGELMSDSCDGYGYESFLAYADDDDAFYCEGEQDVYYRVDSSHYRVDTLCHGTVTAQSQMTKLSDSPAYNLGQVTLSSDQFASVTANDGVCGTVSATSLSFEGSGLESFGLVDRKGWNVSFQAPYDGGSLRMELYFTGEKYQQGTFDVAENGSDSSSNAQIVDVYVYSAAFGGSDSDPAELRASSGAVVIASVTNQSVHGEFDLVMDTGDVMKGSFMLDLR